jgi:hypothetical protein
MDTPKNTETNDIAQTTVEPFNDVTEHYQKIMGMPNKKANISTFPRWLRIFYYTIITIVAVGILILLGVQVFEWTK